MADGSVLIDTKLNTTSFKKDLTSLGSILSKSNLAKMGTTILKSVTAISAGLAAAGGFAVKTGMEFDSAMSQVAATMGLTVDQIDEMRQAAIKYGASTAFSATEAAEALNYLALAGYDVEKAVDVLPSVLDLAAAGGLDLAYASDLATDAMAALGIEATASNLTHFGDEMAKTASKANTSVAQLGEAILTVGGTANSLADGTIELNTALGVLANRGIKGSEAGTHLRNVILSLSAPTDTARKAMDALGLSVTDADGNMRSLDSVMADFNKATEGMSQTAKMDYLSQIFNKTDLAAVQALLAGCGEEWDNLEKEISEADGAMAAMAATQLDNLEGDVENLTGALESLGISAYDNVKEPLREIVQLGTSMIEELTAAMTDGGFMGFASALGSVLSEAVTVISSYAPTVVAMAVSIVQSLVSGISENAGTIGTAVVDILSGISTGAMEILPDLVDAGANLLLSIANGMSDELPSLLTTLSQSLTSVVEKIQLYLPQMLTAGKQLLHAIGDGISENLPTITKTFIDGILSISDAVWDIKSDLLVLGGQILQAIGEGLIDSLPTLVERLPSIIAGIVDFFTTKYEVIAKVGSHLLMKLVDALPQVIEQLTERLPEIIDTITTVLIGSADILLPAATTCLSAIIDALPETIESLIATLPDLIDAVSTTLPTFVPQLTTAATTLFSALADALPAVIETLIAELPDIIDAVVDFVNDNLPTIINAGIQLLTSLATGLIDAIPTLTEKLPVIIDAIWDGLEDVDWLALGKTLLSSIMDGLASIGASLLGLFQSGVDDVKKIKWEDIKTVITTAIGDIGTWLSGMFAAGKVAIGEIDWATLYTTITTSIGDIGAWLFGLFSDVVTDIGTIDWASIYTTITSKIGDVGKWMSSKFSDALTNIKSIEWSGIAAKIQENLGSVGTWFTGLFNTAKTAISEMDWGDIGSTIQTGISDIGSWLSSKMSAALTVIKEINWASVGAAIQTGISDVGSWLSGKLQTAAANIKNIDWADVGTTIGAKIGDVGATLLGHFQTALTAIGNINWASLYTTITSKIGDIGAWLSGCISDGWDTVLDGLGTVATNLLEGLGTGLTNAWNTLQATIIAPFQGVLDAIKNLFGIHSPSTEMKSIGGFLLEGLANGLKDGLDAVLKVVSDIFGTIWDTIKSIFGFGGTEQTEENKEAEQAGQDIMSGLADGVVGSEDTIKAAIQLAAQNMLATLKTELGVAENGGSNTKTKPYGESVAQGMIDGIKTKATEDTFTATMTSLADAAFDAIDAAFGTTGINSSAENFEYVGNGVAQGVVKGIQDKAAEATFTTAVTALSGAALDAVNTSFGTTGKETAATAFVYAGHGVVQAVRDGISTKATEDTFAESMATLAGAALDAINSTFGTAGEETSATEFEYVGLGIVQAVNDGISTKAKKETFTAASGSLCNAAKGAIDTALGITQGSASAFTYVGEGIVIGASDGLGGKAVPQTFTGAANSLASAAATALNSAFGIAGTGFLGLGAQAASKFESIGQAVAQGIANGISNYSGTIASAAKTAANAAYEAAKKTLGINSPSKVFAELGRYCGIGMAQGLANSAESVENAATTLSDQMYDRIRNAVDHQVAHNNAYFDTLTGAVNAQSDRMKDIVDNEDLAKKIWEHAPDVDVYMDSEKVGRLVEPTVSDRQGAKARTMNRRGVGG